MSSFHEFHKLNFYEVLGKFLYKNVQEKNILSRWKFVDIQKLINLHKISFQKIIMMLLMA